MADVAYPSIAALYGARGGESSGEDDFGVMWTDGPRWPTYRVSAVHATGDVYAVRHTDGAAILLGAVGSNGADICRGWRDGRCGPSCAYAAAEAALDGWAEACGRQGLGWIRDRLAR